MRFQSGHAEVLAEGFQQSATFSIAASGKAFKGLLDGIYSRKIEAAIRELATNAFDSHKAASSIAPFEVHLPTMLEPTFYIRDFGTGMSHEFMMTRFAVMFDSTKDGLNETDKGLITPDDQVGMLGLGRMSFFAYTDNCTTTVWQDGEARHYTVFMGPDGVPQVAHAGTVPSDEPTGVKVEFAVRDKDYKEFNRAAVRVFKGFPVMPTGLPAAAQEELRVEPTEVGTFWRAYPKGYLDGSVFWARQGCVLYPVDLLEIDQRAVEVSESYYDDDLGWTTRPMKQLSERYQDFAKVDAVFVIDFPIGGLEFDLGRERLSYNDRTVISLRQRWNEMLNDLGSKLDEVFEGAKTEWEYMCRAGSDKLIDLGLMFKRTPQYERALDHANLVRSLMAPKRSERGAIYPLFSAFHINAKGKHQIIYALDQTGMFDKDKLPGDLDNAFVIHRDKKVSYFNSRAGLLMEQRGAKWAFTVEDREMSKKLLKRLGNPVVIKASELPELPRTHSARTGGGNNGGGGYFDRIKVIYDESSGYRAARNEEEVEGAVYAFLNCGVIHNPDPEKYEDFSTEEVVLTHHILKFFTGRSVALLNIKRNEFDKIDEKWGNLPLFYGCLDDIAKHMKRKDVADMMAIVNWYRFNGSRYYNIHEKWTGAFPTGSTPFHKLGRFNDRYEKIDSKRRSLLVSFLYGGSYAHGHVKTEFMEKVIERARHFGIEVLDIEKPRYGNDIKYPTPLLPPDWERLTDAILVTHVGAKGKHANGKPKCFKKFVFNAIRKEIGC